MVADVDLWLVPQIFSYELAHTLLKAHHQGRIERGDLLDALGTLSDLPFELVSGDATVATRDVFLFAESVGLGAYDAMYLRLAQERAVGIATLDVRLATVARASGVTVYGP